MQKYGWLLFVAGAILTWGAYVVTIDHGRSYMAGLKLAGRPLVPPAVAVAHRAAAYALALVARAQRHPLADIKDPTAHAAA